MVPSPEELEKENKVVVVVNITYIKKGTDKSPTVGISSLFQLLGNRIEQLLYLRALGELSDRFIICWLSPALHSKNCF